MSEEEESLESLLERMEGAVARLSEPDAPLEEMVAQYELASALLANAQERLEVVRSRLEQN